MDATPPDPPAPSPSTVVDLDVNSIFIAPARKRRALDLAKEKDQWFVKNVEQLGILQAIEVREVQGGPKPYELVFGQRRLAAAKHLGMKTISAKVVPLNDEQLTFITVSENTMRRQMTPADDVKAMKILMAAMATVFGTDPGRQVGGKARAKRATRDPQTNQFSAENRTEPASPIVGLAGSAAEPEAENGVKSHAVIAQEIVGGSRSDTFVKMDMARIFSEEDLCVLQLRDISRADMLRISKLEPEAARREAIAHIALGEAGPRAIELAEAKAQADKEEAKIPRTPTEAELSDADWLLNFCYAVRSRLECPKKFDRDALIYRRLRDDRRAFTVQARKDLARGLDQGYTPYARLLYNALYAEHPDRWYVCNECDGRNLEHPDCDLCQGCGYRLAFVQRKK